MAGFFPVGEAGGAHGVYRPGGAALNSGQVGATRAAQFIAAQRADAPLADAEFTAAAAPVVNDAVALVAAASKRAADGVEDNTGTLLTAVQELMSEKAGPVRSAQSIDEALVQVHEWLAAYGDLVTADATSRRSINRTFLVRDTLTAAYVYLSAMKNYVDHGGRSRGSVLYTDASGDLPTKGYGDDADVALDVPDIFRFTLDGGALDDVVQETALIAPGETLAASEGGDWSPAVERDGADEAGEPVFRWRPRRPIPEDDDFFENVWRDFREHGNVY